MDGTSCRPLQDLLVLRFPRASRGHKKGGLCRSNNDRIGIDNVRDRQGIQFPACVDGHRDAGPG